jgi:ABC-type cobalamin/Fe3+-siderophores transport system ATPase subunit
MKIIDFQPGAYRNLPRRTIHFTRSAETVPEEDCGCSIRFLVGKNGTGKTNILRFLASIFLAIEEDYRHPRPNSPAYTVPYRIVYELHGTRIEIKSTGEGRNGVTFTIDEQALEAGEIPARDQVLPTNVLVYTSGDYRDWQSLFRPGSPEVDEDQADTDWNVLRLEEEFSPDQIAPSGQSQFSETGVRPSGHSIGRLSDMSLTDETSSAEDASSSRDTANGPQAAMSPGFISDNRRVNLASATHLKFALLAALLDHQFHNRESSALHDALAEVNLRLLAFSLEHYFNENGSPYREQLVDLFNLATRKIVQWENQLWVYDLGVIDVQSGSTKLQQLAEKQPPFNFYQMLCNLQERGTLINANLVIEYTPDGRTGQTKRVLLTDDLSDGEFAFISRMALIYLLNEKECLFLLDEPEVHFNDDWKRNLVDSIERALTEPKKTDSEVILTTHASIVLTDAFSDEVILMTYAGQQIPPRTLGAEPGELLQSVLGASQTVGKRAIRRIQKALETKDRATLEAMLKQVGPGLYRFTIIEELQDVSPPEKD